MESIPGKQRKGMSVLAAIAGMVITFIGGVFVGLHPSWIPIRGSGNVDTSDMPAKLPAPAVTTPEHPAVAPTQPATRGA